jgi:hypothetical protein
VLLSFWGREYKKKKKKPRLIPPTRGLSSEQHDTVRPEQPERFFMIAAHVNLAMVLAAPHLNHLLNVQDFTLTPSKSCIALATIPHRSATALSMRPVC